MEERAYWLQAARVAAVALPAALPCSSCQLSLLLLLLSHAVYSIMMATSRDACLHVSLPCSLSRGSVRRARAATPRRCAASCCVPCNAAVPCPCVLCIAGWMLDW